MAGSPGDDGLSLYVLRSLPEHRFEVVVDAGCGTGRQTFVLADELETDESVDARGVILADRLIRDGTSPVYWRGDMDITPESALRSVELAVRHARSALHLG